MEGLVFKSPQIYPCAMVRALWMHLGVQWQQDWIPGPRVMRVPVVDSPSQKKGRRPPSFIHIHSHLYCTRERKKEGQRRRRTSFFGVLVLMLLVWSFSLSYDTLFFGHCILVIYIEEVLLVFPLGFSRVNYCVPCDCVSFSDPLYVVIMNMY